MRQLHQDTVDNYIKTQQIGQLNRDTVDGTLTLGHSRVDSTLEHIRQDGYQIGQVH